MRRCGHRHRDQVSEESSGGDGVWPCGRLVEGGVEVVVVEGLVRKRRACSKDLRDAGCWARARDASAATGYRIE
jgi:hypothetical protein